MSDVNPFTDTPPPSNEEVALLLGISADDVQYCPVQVCFYHWSGFRIRALDIAVSPESTKFVLAQYVQSLSVEERLRKQICFAAYRQAMTFMWDFWQWLFQRPEAKKIVSPAGRVFVELFFDNYGGSGWENPDNLTDKVPRSLRKAYRSAYRTIQEWVAKEER